MWLEGSGLGVAIRSAGVWTYGIANLFHILGVATLFGSVLVLDLRLLGAFGRAPLAAVATPTVPLAAAGFVVAALSGSCLIVTNATEYIGNPLLLIKFSGVALGLVNALALGRMPAWRARGTRELTPAEQRQLKWFGGLSLASWLTALACGRLIAYW
jgi:hypothetical protein